MSIDDYRVEIKPLQPLDIEGKGDWESAPEIGVIGGGVVAPKSLSDREISHLVLDANGYIRGGQTGYNTGTGFFLGYASTAYKLSIGDASANFLTFDGTNLAIGGAITATSGTIGSFTIGTYLYSGSKTAWNDANAGVHVGSDGIGIGNNVFTVNGSTGALVATSATITGAITATTGAIGGWTIGATTLAGGDVTLDSTVGIAIAEGTSDDPNTLTWKEGATVRGRVFTWKSGSDHALFCDANGAASNLTESGLSATVSTDTGEQSWAYAYRDERTPGVDLLGFAVQCVKASSPTRTPLHVYWDEVAAGNSIFTTDALFYPGTGSAVGARYIWDNGSATAFSGDIAPGGGTVATTGAIRIANGVSLNARNQGNTANVALIYLDSNNDCNLDAGTGRYVIAQKDLKIISNIYPGNQATRYISDDGTHTSVSAGLSVVGGQIKFPATQAASADANTLDDYEEGPWTPAVGGNATYTTQVGFYIKVGKLVWACGDITINAIGTGTTDAISGLPFTSITQSGISAGTISYWANLSVAPVFLSCYVGSASTTIILTGATAGAASLTLPISVMQNASRIAFSVTYEASA